MAVCLMLLGISITHEWDENITWPYFGVIPDLSIYYLIARRLF